MLKNMNEVQATGLKRNATTFHVIDQTQGRVFPPISKHREVGWKNEAQPSFFNQLQGVWK